MQDAVFHSYKRRYLRSSNGTEAIGNISGMILKVQPAAPVRPMGNVDQPSIVEGVGEIFFIQSWEM